VILQSTVIQLLGKFITKIVTFLFALRIIRKYVIMEAELIAELRKDLSLLNQWIANTEGGSWSTNNLESMKKRRDEIKAVLFDISERKPQWEKS
jgi:hypothetical protein